MEWEGPKNISLVSQWLIPRDLFASWSLLLSESSHLLVIGRHEGNELSLLSAEQTYIQSPKECSRSSSPQVLATSSYQCGGSLATLTCLYFSSTGLGPLLMDSRCLSSRQHPPSTFPLIPFLLPQLSPLACGHFSSFEASLSSSVTAFGIGGHSPLRGLTGSSGSPGTKDVMEQEKADPVKENQIACI